MIETVIDMVLFVLLALTALALLRLTALFGVVMLSAAFSLLAALVFVRLDAGDVALTEAAVGAGISTLLMLGTLALTSRREKPPTRSRILPLSVVLLTGAVLLYGTLDMPHFGDPEAPAQTHVAPDYLANAIPDTGVPNVVTVVLASYRGFDTLGEVYVIFVAGVVVLLLMAGSLRNPELPTRSRTLGHHLVLRVVTKVLIGPILIFALYIQFHGDYVPGGGFQAGIVFAAAFIIYALVFGLDLARRAVPGQAIRLLLAGGVILFSGVGVISFFFGENYLNYSVLALDPKLGQHIGIILVEFGVGMTVAAVMISTYYTFAGQNPPIGDEEW